MSLEQELKMAKFRNDYQKALVSIICTNYQLTEKLKPIFEREGITQQQFNILRILRGAHGPISTLEIRSRMIDKMSDTSRLVDRLLAKGLVEKKTCFKDKRRVDVVISKKGLAVLNKMEKYDGEMDALLKMLNARELTSLIEILEKIRG